MPVERDDSDAEPGCAAAPGTSPLFRDLTRGRFSVVRPMAQWYVLATSAELGREPLERKVLDLPIVLFRDGAGRASALLDRCPHRNVPLSLGEVTEGQLQCAYHGWRFDGAGTCKHIPSLKSDVAARARNVPAFPVRELEGFVWVYPTAGAEPTSEPYRFRLLDEPGYGVARHIVEAPGTLHATIENALDVPHTQFLHRGLFRSASRGVTIRAVVRRHADRVEAEYVGEPRPTGIVGKILSPSGGVVTHFDRFLLPSIAEVEYRIGEENHILVVTAMTPVEAFLTRVYSVVCFRTRMPRVVLEPIIVPLALKIFAQDATMLGKQTALIKAFGGEQFASTEIDVLGRHIWRLMRSAERGDVQADVALLEQYTVELVV